MIRIMGKIDGRRNNGRPFKYDRIKVMKRLVQYMSAGMTLKEACQQPDMPNQAVILEWVTFDDNITELYLRARRAWSLYQAEKIVEIADDESRDQVPDGKGGFKSDNTAVNRDNLRVRTRQALMSRYHPKVFGEKIEQQVTGKDGAALQVVINVNTKQQGQIGATPKQITHESEE